MDTYSFSHKDLLVMAIRAQVKVFNEFYGDIRYECRKLQRWANKYAGIHDIDIDISDELCGIYYEDE